MMICVTSQVYEVNYDYDCIFKMRRSIILLFSEDVIEMESCKNQTS